MDDFQTEENESKKKFNFNFKGLIPIFIVFIIIMVVIVVAVLISKVVANKNNKKKLEEEKNENIVNLNTELNGAYAFAREGNYIVVLRKDKDSKKIYNLSQGTGNWGDFLDYTYHDKKLYLLFDNTIQSISLTDGNGIYELKKEYTYEKVSCKDGKKGASTNIAVTDSIIYFNNSSCAISGFNYITDDSYDDEEDSEEIEDTTETTETDTGDSSEYDNGQVNIYQFNTLKKSSMVYDDGILYFTGDDKIFMVSEEDGEIKELVKSNINDLPIAVMDGILLYSNKNADNTYNFFGYNPESGESAEIVKNTKKVLVYDEKYYYYDNTGVYAYDGEEVESIYSIRYNELSNMEIYNGLLQIVDKSTIGDDKKRITNIDLTKDYKKSISTHEYTMIRNIDE